MYTVDLLGQQITGSSISPAVENGRKKIGTSTLGRRGFFIKRRRT